MIVTIDGPSGAGKSTVAKRLAASFGFHFLNTGAMYRTVALAAARIGHDWSEAEALVELAQSLDVEFEGDRVRLSGEDVSDAIRTPEITAVTKYAADNAGVREVLVDWQRAVGRQGDLVSDGRDQGTVVFPSADVKFFLTASPEERARRRWEELVRKGSPPTFESVLLDQNQRDARDSGRAVGPLRPAEDAIHVHTDGLTLDEVVDKLSDQVRRALRRRNAAQAS